MSIDPTAVGASSGPHSFSYGAETAILYALGIGARRDELDYLFEGRGPRVFPTFAVVPAAAAVFGCMGRVGGSLESLVHGSQSITLHGSLPAEATLSTTGKVAALYDLKRFTQVVITTETRDAAGRVLCETEWMLLLRGVGGFGGPRPPKEAAEAAVPKDRPADFRVEEATSPEQALLYRLSGDRNPLHADPELAARVGFPQGPILHGLCTLGYAARALIKAELGGDGGRLRRLGANFRKPVWPGETLVTEGWRIEGGKIALSTTVLGRPEPVLTGAWAEVSPAGFQPAAH